MRKKIRIMMRTPEACAFAIAATAIALSVSASAAEPVVVWDGAVAAYDFSTLTRTVGDVTYTLNLNPVGSANTVAADSSYVQIADADAQCGITITTQNSNSAVTNGFGTSGTVSVLMKCRDMPVTAGSNRAIIALMDGRKYKYGGTTQQDNGAVLGMYIKNGSSGWIWRGSTAGMAGLSGSFLNTVSGKFSADEQVVALTYSNSGGTCYYVNGELAQSESGLKDSTYLARPYGIALGGVDVSTGSQFYALKNMKIEAIAIFSSTLTADEVASYTFPSEMPMSGTIAVSDINALFGSASEISVRLADGATVNGDTTFNASTVHFICDGSFTIAPPSGNTAAFDFFGVAGQPVIAYDGAIPTKIGSVFTSTTVPTWVTDSAQWTGTVWLKNVSGITGDNFHPNDYGNADSTLRLTGISGWMWTDTPATIVPVVELEDGEAGFALRLSDGYSYGYGGNYVTAFTEIKGTGTLVGCSKAPFALVNFRKWSDFAGTLSLTNKIAVFGAEVPSTSEVNMGGGEVWIMADAQVDIPNGRTWHAPNGIKVSGTLTYASLARLSAGTAVVLRDSGLIDVPGTGSTANFAMDFSKVSGSGAIKYTGSSWGGISTNHLADTIGAVLENSDGVIVPNAITPTPAPKNVITNGFLSGSGKLRCDYNWNGNGINRYRTFRVQQDRDSTWSGTHIDEQGRLTLSVAPGESSAGTLTLSGTNTLSAALVVEEGGSVNLTGTWVGPVTVYGSISGTGTVDGDLTLGDGATINIDLNNPLGVKGKIIEGNDVTVNPQPVSLNGTAQSLERTLELVRMFGRDALSEDGVAFTLNGIDLGEGTLKMSVSPPVRNGTLSVMGKRELGDRWRRVRVAYGDAAYGTDMSIDDGDAADCRFFQIRAELGEKSSDYAVAEVATPGDSGNTEVKSHCTSTSTGGETVLLSLTLDGGEPSDYSADAYKTLSFELEGVTPGATATLATNGTVAATAIVAEDGTAVFHGVPRLGDGVTLSLGVCTSDAAGNIVTTNLAERAGVLSYFWGDSATNEVSGSVTNTMTLLANRPRKDGLGGGDKGAYRIPAVAKSTNDVVVAVYDCRHFGSSDLGLGGNANCIDLGGNVSCDGGLTWTKPSLLIDVDNSYNQNDGSFIHDFGKDTDIGDPCILYVPAENKFMLMGITGGGVWSAHVNGEAAADLVLYVRGGRKDDKWDGRRSIKGEVILALHEANNDIPDDENEIRGVLQGPGHGIVQRKSVTNELGEVVMPEGAIIFPMQYFGNKSSLYDSRTFAIYSTNAIAGTEQWRATNITSDDHGTSQENCIAELDDGSWLMMAKHPYTVDGVKGKRLFFRTTDYVNWTYCTNVAPSMTSQGSCLWLGDGVKAEFGGVSRYVACHATSAGRGDVTLLFGRDTTASMDEDERAQGVVWDCGSLDFYPESTSGYSYSSMFMVDSWTLGVVFEAHGHIYLRKVDVRAFLTE